MTAVGQCQLLPKNPFSGSTDAAIHDAYGQCVLSEADASTDAKFLMYARCLGYLILEAPYDDARSYISHEILRCGEDSDRLNSLVEFYIRHLFRLFRLNKGHTPGPSDHPSRPSSEIQREFFSLPLNPTPKDHTAAKRAALERDNYRCTVTGFLDESYWMSLSVDERAARNITNATLINTNYCHIFPPSTNWDLEQEKNIHPKTHYSGSAWALLDGFAGIKVLDELNGSDCHKLYNGLTLAYEIRKAFDRLLLWFEAIPNTQHSYRVCTLYPNMAFVAWFPVDRIVTFTTTTGLPLPDPRYLRLHATICRVAHQSGVFGYLDTFERELEETMVLANDGSSAQHLVWCLQDIQTARKDDLLC